MHQSVPQQAGVARLLRRAQQDGGIIRDAVFKEVVVELSLIAGAEAQLQGLFGLIDPGGGAVELHAAVQREALLPVIEHDRAEALLVQLGVGIDALVAAEEALGIADQAHHREAVTLVEDVAQAQGAAGQGVPLKAHRPEDRGLLERERSGIALRLLRGDAAVGGVADLPRGGERDLHGLHALKDAVALQAHRLCRDPAEAVPVFLSRCGGGKIPEALFSRHAAHAAAEGDVVQAHIVLQFSLGIEEIEPVPSGVEAEAVFRQPDPDALHGT